MIFQVFDIDSVCRQLFFYGKDVEIISPEDVRERMKEMLEKSLSVYK
jgi:predicted DNA-binding transcriptional regulator YafY